MSQHGLEESYFRWLYSMIGAHTNKNPARSYQLLAEQMLRKPFRWHVPNDDNRILDGLKLREEFEDMNGAWNEMHDILGPCSVLELFIALARLCDYQVAFGDDSDVSRWFWQLVANLGLDEYNDETYCTSDVHDEVDHILETVIDRSYKRNGHGGLFPLKHPTEDQRNVELWYQLSAYLLENVEFAD